MLAGIILPALLMNQALYQLFNYFALDQVDRLRTALKNSPLPKC